MAAVELTTLLPKVTARLSTSTNVNSEEANLVHDNRLSVNIVIPRHKTYEAATVVRWLKAEGDMVCKDEPVLEVAFPKATQQVEAPVSGKLIKIVVEEGGTAGVQETVGEIEPSEG